MALFEEIKRKVSDTTHEAVKVTKGIAEIGKMNSQISIEQRNVDNLYFQIGKLYFDNHSTNFEPPFCELSEKVVAANQRIEQLQEEVLVARGLKRCVNCGAEVPVDSSFCGKCGKAVDMRIVTVEVTQNEAVKYCASCNAELKRGALFCDKCGQKV